MRAVANQSTQPKQIKTMRVKKIASHPVPNLSYPITTHYDKLYIDNLRSSINKTLRDKYFSGNPNFENITDDLLYDLFALYDKHFFGNRIAELMKKENASITFKFSDALSRAGGYCSKKGCNYEIKLAKNIFLNLFNANEKAHISNGLYCYDRLDCLMNVFEHELMHFVVNLTVPSSDRNNPVYKSHGSYFKQLVNSYFGHTEVKHLLSKGIDTIKTQADFDVNDHVYFIDKNNGKRVGIIVKLNPTCAVVETSKGKSNVPYSILYHVDGTEETDESHDKQIPKLKDEEKLSKINSKEDFNIGESVSFNMKSGEVVHGTIVKLNPIRAVLETNKGKFYVPYGMLYHVEETDNFNVEQKPKAEEKLQKINSKNDFNIGDSVSFNMKLGEVAHGIIVKLNPKRAVVDTTNAKYNVAYQALSHVT